jgi:UDP-glucuronate 4-epimerase
MSMSASVLVTGGNGFIGREVCRILHARGAPVVASDVAFDGNLDGAPWERSRCDLTDAAQVESLFRTREIGRIVHSGAISGPMLSHGDPLKMHRVNAVGTLYLLEAARTRGIGRFVLLSSIAAYGDHPTQARVPETAALLATDPYGASKVAAERFALCYRTSFDMPVVALRVASVYGPGRRTPCLVRALIDSARADAARVDISRSPLSLRQMIHVDDCVQGVLLALDARAVPQFAYNIASGTAIPEAELAVAVSARFTGTRYHTFDTPRYFDGRIGPLDIGAAARDLGFVPRISLDQGLSSFQSAT